jgi:hypothetical protein
MSLSVRKGVVVVSLAAIALGACGNRTAEPVATEAAAAAPSSTLPVCPTQEQAQAAIGEQWRSGWAPYGDKPGDPSRPYGYIRLVAQTAAPAASPIYDRPDGQVIAYAVRDVGIVDRASYEAGTYDAAAVRLQMAALAEAAKADTSARCRPAPG